ncbi:sporulation-specific N-formyltyrosine oxidase Dit2 [Penicillium malachiteum]|uniref:sporulation-specific N-formyltyrosine oxidase Dit2 n=1 Tax=Penicillium malachiteum TaxID=1324776 RepID=UPI002546A390|nr:sporulation-specific N-formyltyrosine oxidase Dit2 [Penicillium malachiteum]KAJ5715362.1 sporulation-specific N-formyltyrosine oxidase Dit2 [Penicillium malachiteum]
MGENIIDAHEDEWRYIASVMKPGIQRTFSIASLVKKSQKLARLFLETQRLNAPENSGVTVDPLTHRWSVSTYCEYFLDVEVECLERSDVRLEKLMGKMGDSVIPLAPLFTEFPIIERLWWLFPDRRRAFGYVDEIEKQLVAYTEQHMKIPPSPENADKMIHGLQRARAEGSLSEYRYRSNLNMLFVAGTENIQIALTSAMWELAKNLDLQSAVRDEVIDSLPGTYSGKDINNLPRLTSLCLETLRLYPPLSQLVGRYALDDMPLDEENVIPKGTWVGWSAYGVQTDPNVWGPRVREFNPSRWGTTIEQINDAFRMHQAKGNFITFNGYTRRCLGSHFALTQFKVVLCELLRALKWTRDPSYKLETTVRVLMGPSKSRLIFTELGDERS